MAKRKISARLPGGQRAADPAVGERFGKLTFIRSIATPGRTTVGVPL